MQSDDPVMTIGLTFCNWFAGGLQKSEPLKVWDASDLVFGDLSDTWKRDSMIYGSSSISKNCVTLHLI